MPTARRRLGNSGTGGGGELLTKEQRGIAIAQAKETLEDLGIGWEYSLPVKKKKVIDVGRREGSLGAWRPSGAGTAGEDLLVTDEEDDSDMDTYDDDDYDEDEDYCGDEGHVHVRNGGSSYRRATTPPPAPKRQRRQKRKQEGVWKMREDDSDVELNIVPPDRKAEQYVWESPDDIPTPERIREEQRRVLEEEMEWNKGLKLWVHRRDAWTGANEGGEVRVGDSRFKDVCTEYSLPFTLPLIPFVPLAYPLTNPLLSTEPSIRHDRSRNLRTNIHKGLHGRCTAPHPNQPEAPYQRTRGGLEERRPVAAQTQQARAQHKSQKGQHRCHGHCKHNRGYRCERCRARQKGTRCREKGAGVLTRAIRDGWLLLIVMVMHHYPPRACATWIFLLLSCLAGFGFATLLYFSYDLRLHCWGPISAIMPPFMHSLPPLLSLSFVGEMRCLFSSWAFSYVCEYDRTRRVLMISPLRLIRRLAGKI